MTAKEAIMDHASPSLPVTTRGYCTLCRSRCGAIYTVQDGRMLRVDPDRDHPTGGALCAKGRAAPEIVHHPDRLTVPMRRTNPKGSADPGWQEIGYEEALDEIAARMADIRDRYGAEAVAIASTTPSGTAISDSIDWILRLAWQFGTPNLVTSVEVCNFQKDYAQAFTFGLPLGVPDFANADTIILWGHNPARTWLAEAQRIAEARQRGARIVVIDPKRSGSGEQSDLWLRIRPGSDAALAMGAVRFLIEQTRFAQDFVRDWTDAAFLVDRQTGEKLSATAFGADAGFVIRRKDGSLETVNPAVDYGVHPDADLFFDGTIVDTHGHERHCATSLALLYEASLEWTPSQVAAATGIPETQLAEFFEVVASSPSISYYHWTGIAQALNATQTTRAISNLFALRDDVDRAGGNRWFAGPLIAKIADFKHLPASQLEKALGRVELPLGPPRFGFITARDLCESIEGNAQNRVRALIGFGANMPLTHPDARRTKRALEALDFQVHCDLFMTPMADTADILLPVTAPWEHDAMRVGFEISARAASHIQFRPALLPAPGKARPDYAIARGLGQRLGLEGDLWQGPFVKAIDTVLEPTGLSVDRLRASPEGITLAQPATERAYAARDASGAPVGFPTPSKRIEFHSGQLQAHGYPAIASAAPPLPVDPEFPITLTTAKSGYYTHSSLRNITSLRRRSADPAIEISPALAAREGLSENDWALVTTTNGTVRLRVRIDGDLADDVAIAEFGWWQGNDALGRPSAPTSGEHSSNINAIISDETRDPLSGAPPLRHMVCAIRRDVPTSIGNWSGERSFIVKAREKLAGHVLRLVLVPEDGLPLPAFLPGQHIGVRIPGAQERRFYSLICDGASSDSFEVAVRRSPSADPLVSFSMSHHFHDHLEVGAELMVTPPSGSFVISPSIDRPIVCIAGGIGITPFLSALRAAAKGGSTAPIMLHYVAGTWETATFERELADLARNSDWLSLNLWLRRGDARTQSHVRTGGDIAHIVATMDDALLARRPLVYLCGPAALMDGVRQALVARGMPTADIIAEAFKSELALPKDIAPARITLARSGASFEWTKASGSLLSAALAAGISLPSGCQVGQCESCAVKVTEGQFLCPVETELAPDSCLTCQSIPLSDMILDV
ncbi:molybdopterin-dependent oxidoreductase [Agrobacterium sp. lyk4-40-TYG-31]|uniref:molybdopterin-dependent oxidoreductase n=1 Tax=Agrobacterium sp. lyk4-40-TYG-31 TaxID=3040276 RepID=UPI002550F77C|nr:molybdopterin-dependent oxidoreductase [Agrobacterium sp. lyk4-40-TYG-31]